MNYLYLLWFSRDHFFNVKVKSSVLTFLSVTFLCFSAYAEEIPLVYDVENTGADCQEPPLPGVDQLPSVSMIPDPFEWSDGSSRSTNFSDWGCRRNEIKEEIENYEIGPKPDKPNDITASFNGSTLTVNIPVDGNTLTLTSQVTLPAGNGPFPAVIGINSGTGSLPSSIFTSRNVAQIQFNFDQVMAHQQTRGSEPINTLYPSLIHMGAYAAWSWGISRIIDGLELTQSTLPIDLQHLSVTGCSFAGKMALFAGSFDERIALTIAQEPGGGGHTAWRVSKTLGDVETLCATSHAWFMESMFDNFCGNEDKLPHDHHELMAMAVPRALLVLGNPDYEWMAEESGYISSRAAHEVWKKFGIEDRFGFSIVGGHTHCSLPTSQYSEVEAFVDKFLLGKTSANTNVTTHPYPNTDHEAWYADWLNETTDSTNATTAEGGADQAVVDSNDDGAEIVTLDGSSSRAADGATIISYIWTEDGNEVATGISPSVSLTTGTHNITLTVTDNTGATDTASVVIRVTSASDDNDIEDNEITVRALGMTGDEHINLLVGGSVIADWTLAASYADYSASTSLTGDVEVEFDNDDDGNRDVRVDYILVNGNNRESEDQANNTAVYQNGSCGGSYSELMHCNGTINFGPIGSTNSLSETQDMGLLSY
jgi:hypothetical protein